MDTEREIKKILERNRRVEGEKAWETSSTRRIVVALLTYIVVVIFFLVSKLPHPFLNALVPSLAFILSTLSVSLLKKFWLKKYFKNN